MRKFAIATGRIALATVALALAASATAFAQAAAPAASADQQAIQDAAKKAYQAISDSHIDDLWVLVVGKYDHKLRPEKLRVTETGPKLDINFDGSVKVLRSTAGDAVVAANFFKPTSSDTPVTEVQTLKLYMVKDHGAWKITAPNKKEAAYDADHGGWYHAGSFTFCPNKGMVFLPNHFSSKTDCTGTAVCR